MAQGGKRVWHDRVFALESPSVQWREIGRLPRPLGYGVSGIWQDAVVVAGGSDATRHYADAWLLRLDGHKLEIEVLPDLPVPAANSCGSVVGDILYVTGGQMAPDTQPALSRCFCCDLSAPRREWREVPWPAAAPGRILAVAGGRDDAFFMFSGAALAADGNGKVVRTYLTDAWRYRPSSGWERLAELPRPAAAAPSPAWQYLPGQWAIPGGIWAEYLGAAESVKPYPGFSREVLLYSEEANSWSCSTITPTEKTYARIVAPSVTWRSGVAVISGEIAPGQRAVNSEFFAVNSEDPSGF